MGLDGGGGEPVPSSDDSDNTDLSDLAEKESLRLRLVYLRTFHRSKRDLYARILSHDYALETDNDYGQSNDEKRQTRPEHPKRANAADHHRNVTRDTIDVLNAGRNTYEALNRYRSSMNFFTS